VSITELVILIYTHDYQCDAISELTIPPPGGKPVLAAQLSKICFGFHLESQID
jgi:hypothetical protein